MRYVTSSLSSPRFRNRWIPVAMGVLLVSFSNRPFASGQAVDLRGYQSDSGVSVSLAAGGRLLVTWPIDRQQQGQIVLDLHPDAPLIQRIEILKEGVQFPIEVLGPTNPALYLTVGTRRVPGGKPPDQKWQVFFDKPADRDHSTYPAQLGKDNVSVVSRGKRTTIEFGPLTAGADQAAGQPQPPLFTGRLELTVYANSPLIRIDGVLQTDEDGLALIYDAGLVSDAHGMKGIYYLDTDDQWRSIDPSQSSNWRPLTTRHRTAIARAAAGCIACFSPPHEFQFPRDWTNNLGYNWFDSGRLNGRDVVGFGIRQAKEGGGSFVPWFNAPPDREHRMGAYYLISSVDPESTLQSVLALTRGDRFQPLPGYLTMTSHWHMAVAVEAQKRIQQGRGDEVPEFVQVFRDLGVNIVHLGDFHGDGHQRDPGPLRLPELETLFHECRRLSDDQFLLLPGEEVNTYLGMQLEGKHPGHWMSLFPRPVYWTMTPDDERPFADEHPRYGRVYHVGDRADMIHLLREENGLVWSAHPRIKASSWTPDIFRHEDFFLADFWLGGAWKAMPADLSQDRLGRPVLDLLDDMANWGQRKYVLGEVDVFKIDRSHELYGHMNINYVRLDKLPRFDDGWDPLLDALRQGRFFVSTGEVLIPEFHVEDAASGETLRLPADGTQSVPTTITAELQWTFPLEFAEIISGDGREVYRERIDLSHTTAMGTERLEHRLELSGRHWVRLEVWDSAKNGAFTQPVWLLAP